MENSSGFQRLQIKEELVLALLKHNITQPTKVQEQVIPLIKQGKDLLCQSETGSGKTLSFAIPIIEKLQPAGGARVLIVAPTRELAKQIAGEFRKFTKELKIITVYGGVAMGPQIEKIPEADVVVGTPGRILDLYRQNYLKLDLVSHLVLDECDRMFDMGFIQDVEAIIYATPASRQVLLFSATVSTQIKEITAKYMKSPEHIRITPHLVKGKLNQSYYVCAHNEKISLLAHILQEHKKEMRTIVFCKTKRLVDMVVRALNQNGFKADALHGDISQAKRERVVDDFTKGKVHVVIATDVASRGLHIDDVGLVVNYNLPEETETFVHRVGRTARQGKSGNAITLLDENDFRIFDDIMHHYEGEIEKKTAEGVRRVLFRKDDSRNNRNQRPNHSRRDSPRDSNRGPSNRTHVKRYDSHNSRPQQHSNNSHGHSLADLD